MNDNDPVDNYYTVDNYYSDAHDEEWFKDFRQLNIENDPLIEDVLEEKLGQDIIATVTKIVEAI